MLGLLKTKELCALLRVMQLAETKLGLLVWSAPKLELFPRALSLVRFRKGGWGTVGRYHLSLLHSFVHTNLFSQCILFLEY